MTEQDAFKGLTEQIQNQSDPTKPIRAYEAEVVPSSHSSYEEQNKTKEDQPKWTDKAVAFFTICLVGVAIWQAVIFNRQWEEMHTGGEDTKALATAADTQAKAAKAQADEAKEQVGKMVESLAKTDALIRQATAQATATNRLAVQAQRSADYAKQAVDNSIESERPWVGVSSYRVDNFVEGKTAKITINITNSGKRPASSKAIYEAAVFKSLPLFPSVTGQQTSLAYILPGAPFSSTLTYDVSERAFSDWKNKGKFSLFCPKSYTQTLERMSLTSLTFVPITTRLT
ncbi:hypothetical protein [Tunturiibacter gelidiferens]|uniref:hypothetical protein n=1 Tax=Tunturiibacter gelidiferens TaxID=3069689 RepID=UPI003D9B969E